PDGGLATGPEGLPGRDGPERQADEREDPRVPVAEGAVHPGDRRQGDGGGRGGGPAADRRGPRPAAGRRVRRDARRGGEVADAQAGAVSHSRSRDPESAEGSAASTARSPPRTPGRGYAASLHTQPRRQLDRPEQ